MINLDSLKQLDPTKIDLTRFDVRKIELPKLDTTKLDPRKIELPKLDTTKLDPRKIELPKLDTTKLDPRKIELPKFDLPKVDVPFDLPKMDLPKVDVDRVTGLARDAAYVGIGAVVVATRAADERRRSVADQVTGRVRKLVDAVA